jgi:hypothetical protein
MEIPIFHNNKGLHNMRNLPETTNNIPSILTTKLFSSFLGAILIAISEINYVSTALNGITSTNTRIWAQTEAYELHAGRNSSGLDRHASRKSKLKFLVVTQRMSSRS